MGKVPPVQRVLNGRMIGSMDMMKFMEETIV